jgi:hypothetical protein
MKVPKLLQATALSGALLAAAVASIARGYYIYGGYYGYGGHRRWSRR